MVFEPSQDDGRTHLAIAQKNHQLAASTKDSSPLDERQPPRYGSSPLTEARRLETGQYAESC
jgi:hypothetical protein